MTKSRTKVAISKPKMWGMYFPDNWEDVRFYLNSVLFKLRGDLGPHMTPGSLVSGPFDLKSSKLVGDGPLILLVVRQSVFNEFKHIVETENSDGS